MKAKFKATGETVEVEPCGVMNVACCAYITEDGRNMPGVALEFENEINWEQRRYEIAKTALHGNLTGPIIDGVDPNPSIESLAKWSVKIADTLIAELKKGGIQ